MNKHRQPLTPAQQAAGNDYRFGWRAHALGIRYVAMRSEDERDGWVASWDTALQSPALAAVREAVQQ